MESCPRGEGGLFYSVVKRFLMPETLDESLLLIDEVDKSIEKGGEEMG